jgi:hypothetical protein
MAPILGLASLFGFVGALTVSERVSGLRLPSSVELVILLGIMVAAFWLACVYWRRIDEAAKAAQKTAYFWGASLGGGVGIAVCALLGKPFAAGYAHWLSGLAPQVSHLVLGGLIVLVVQTLGFLAAWAMWWRTRR